MADMSRRFLAVKLPIWMGLNKWGKKVIQSCLPAKEKLPDCSNTYSGYQSKSREYWRREKEVVRKKTDARGFWCWNLNPKELTKLVTEVEDYLKATRVYTAIALDQRRFAFATMNGGIVIINSEGKLLQMINSHRGLVNNFVTGLYQDQQQNLWATTIGGISHINRKNHLRSGFQWRPQCRGFSRYCISSQLETYFLNA